MKKIFWGYGHFKVSLTVIGLKGMLLLLLLVFGLFFQSVNITKRHVLIKTADVIVSVDAAAVQSVSDGNEN